MYLAIANLLHHKIRSLLSALAVGIGVAMLVTLLGLTHGTLDEITHRGRTIRADFLIVPADYDAMMGGAPFHDKHLALAKAVRMDGRPLVDRAAPVYRGLTTITRAGSDTESDDLQTAFGIHRADWEFFCSEPLVAGRLFQDPPDQDRRLLDLLARHIDGKDGPASSQPNDEDLKTLDAAFELVIDQRLARFARINEGDFVVAWGRRFKIVGIAPEGVTVRVFAPLATMRYINETPGGATFLLIKLAGDVDHDRARAVLRKEVGGKTLTVAEYSSELTKRWKVIPQYTQITSIVEVSVAFLFVLVIMYTVVIQRTREIGILKSLGAGNFYIVRIVLAESMMLSLAGTAIGLAVSVAAKAAIIHFKPLLTVDLNGIYLLAGVATGVVGGLLSGLYPAVVAARQDPVTALSYE